MNYKKYENHRIPIENSENHENHKIIIENHEKHLNIEIQKKTINENHENHRIPNDNNENDENPRISCENQTFFGDHRIPIENYKKLKILEFCTIITKIIVFHARITQIMKFIEFN